MKVTEIILHCTASKEGVNLTVNDVNSLHIKNGWAKIGYHYLIYLDGSIHTGRTEIEDGAHCKGHNKRAIGICYVGGLDKKGKPKDTRTPEQQKALVSLVKQLMTKYNLTEYQVHCHNEFANKACPCFKIESFRKELSGASEENVSIQISDVTLSSTPVFKKFKKGWLGHKDRWTMSSPMGIRKHPNGKIKLHNGNDIATPVGTKIYAPCDGTVEGFRQKKGEGLFIILKSSNGYWFYFMYLSKIIKSGSVKEGDLIAETGGDPIKDPENAGGSTGPHLHFEVRLKGDVSKLIDGKYFVTDLWVTKHTGTEMTSSSDMPFITDSELNYTESQKAAVKQEYAISESDVISIKEQDVSGDTDWGATESEDNISEEEVVVEDRVLKDGFVPGIWQIMKLVMDEDVANLRIRDAATSLQQGSLINFFQKVCQQPFAEFFGDTYGDQYYFIARKPPFDKEGMKKTMTAQGLFEKSIEEKTIYDIYENDIITSNISFNNQNIYSWYQFIPIYELGVPTDLQYVIPAVLFPEYAAIWGSKSLCIRSQYRNFQNSNISDKVKNEEKSEQGDAEVRHSIHDLKYIIESNAYNPFVRQGTINIFGNRKIKRGTFVRVFWNSLEYPEIFYVESVGQNYSINSGGISRTTTLNLSHGMLSNYMFDNALGSVKIGYDDIPEEEKKTMSYFNIIDFGDYEKYKDKIDMDKWREIISGWKVNISAFMFFLRKTHFLNNLNDKQSVMVFENKK